MENSLTQAVVRHFAKISKVHRDLSKFLIGARPPQKNLFLVSKMMKNLTLYVVAILSTVLGHSVGYSM